MNRAIQDQLESQYDEAMESAYLSADVELKPLVLTPADIERFQRETAIVEIDISTGESRIVSESDKPILTHKILKTKGARLHTDKILFDGENREVKLTHGLPLGVLIEQSEMMQDYDEAGANLSDPTIIAELNLGIQRLLIAKSFRDPLFSWQGKPPEDDVSLSDCFPIESCSEVLLMDLWDIYQRLHNTEGEPESYQVEILKGIPLDIALITGKGFDVYPVGGESLRILDMPEDERIAYIAETEAKTRTFVASMILNPPLSIDDKGPAGAYPIEKLSEFFISTLYNAQKAVNAPNPTHEMLSDLWQRGQTEIGKHTFIEAARMGRDYGQRPSDLIRGDPIDYAIDSIISRTLWKHEADEHKRMKQERNNK